MPNFQLFDRVVVGVDVQEFSARNDRRQLLIMEKLDRMLTDAARAANLDRAGWDRRAEGDGEVAVLPADVDMVAIVRRFVTELDQRLIDHNQDHGPETRIRLRVAMNIGTVIPDGILGYGGTALIHLSRLLDSREVRKALVSAAEASLALIISESLFERAVVPEIGGIRPEQFRKVMVDNRAKRFRQTAYLYLPCGWPKQPPVQIPASRPIIPLPIPHSGTPWTPPSRLTPVKERADPEPAYPPLADGVKDLLKKLGDEMDARNFAEADRLTTRILLEAADRSEQGLLRTSDAERLPDSLFTELNDVWSGGSQKAWGFAAQRRMLADRPGRISFHQLSRALGWRQSDDALPPPHQAFIATAGDESPFFPTLRNPDRENGRGDAWREEWRTTALSVHHRLQRWRVK